MKTERDEAIRNQADVYAGLARAKLEDGSVETARVAAAKALVIARHRDLARVGGGTTPRGRRASSW